MSPAALTRTLLPARVTCGGGSFPQLLWDQGRERFTGPGSPGCSQHAVASTFGASGREFLLAGPAPALRVSVRVLGLWLLSGAAGKRGSGASRAPHGALGPGPAPSPLRRGFVGFVIQGRPLFVCRRCRPRILFTAFDTHWPFCGGAKVGPVVLTRRVSLAACSTCARTAIRSRNRNHRPFRKFNDT